MESQNTCVAEEYYNRGVEKYFYKRYQQAVDNFTTAIHLEPEDSDFYFSRGCTYLMLDQKHNALEDFLTAKRLGENVPQKYLDDCEWYCRPKMCEVKN